MAAALSTAVHRNTADFIGEVDLGTGRSCFAISDRLAWRARRLLIRAGTNTSRPVYCGSEDRAGILGGHPPNQALELNCH